MSTLYESDRQTCSEKLYVIGVVSNPAQYARRYQLFEEFCTRMRAEPQVVLLTIEVQQKSRPFATSADIRLKTSSEIWHKENMINLAVQYLPPNWKYMAWIDSDITFTNENWVRETLDELQTYDVLQLFSQAVDFGPKKQTMQVHTGFAYSHCMGYTWKPPGYGKYWHSGYAWGISRRMYEQLGGLLDFCILGSADHHMAMAMIGQVDQSLNAALHPTYVEWVRTFQERCDMYLKQNIGYVNGTILHEFHGSKKNRFYRERWLILTENRFDPLHDLKRDAHGLWALEPSRHKLRDDIRRYFRARNEDSCDWDPPAQ